MAILVLAPHTDDETLGCGGTICRLVDLGESVYITAFSTGNPETGASREEFKLACRHHLRAENWRALDFECRRFDEHRQGILDIMIELRRQYAPDIVLIPSDSGHQDHAVIHHEARRAFQRCTVLGYELPWGHRVGEFRPALWRVMGERHLVTKVDALACYRSQSERHYASPRQIRALAMMRGAQVGEQYAEAFEVYRWIER